MNKPDEPIALSAPLARQLAARHCRKDPVSGEDCSWYHGFWQDLRLIGFGATPESQRDFFLSAFQGLSSQRRLRILIAGAADYSILAHVLWACDESGTGADVTVIDRCDTPLHLNKWYAARAGREIATVCHDIFDYQPDTLFDVVCSHSFLIKFPQQQRARLVTKWAQMLAPTGSIVAVTRIRPNDSPPEVRFSQEEVRRFCETVERRCRESGFFDETEAKAMLERGRIYAQRRLAYAVSSEEISALLQQNGFQVVHSSTIASSDARNLAAAPKEARHACVVATKDRSA